MGGGPTSGGGYLEMKMSKERVGQPWAIIFDDIIPLSTGDLNFGVGPPLRSRKICNLDFTFQTSLGKSSFGTPPLGGGGLPLTYAGSPRPKN